MASKEEGQTKQKRELSRRAIALAIEGKWEEAVAVNLEISANYPDEVETYNRLGRAYLELGRYADAREAYQQTLALDPPNIIARKNLERFTHLTEDSEDSAPGTKTIDPQQFIKEIGKTGVAELYDLAQENILARLTAGDNVHMEVDGNDLKVRNNRGEYIGLIDPRHGQRLVKLIGGGNQYSAAITTVATDRVVVIIREIYQDPSQDGIISFPARNIKAPKPYVSQQAFKGDLDYEGLMAEEAMESEEESGGIQE